jgi:sec-independent protein translocase protein TatC
MDDLNKKTRSALTRAELPGMSLIEHLEELRKRLIHSAIYLAIGFILAYAFHERLYGFIQAPNPQVQRPELNLIPPLTAFLSAPASGKSRYGRDRCSSPHTSLRPQP